jgi:arachidonate 15-lipoxygenase
VNFPQWDYMAFTPNMPGFARQAPWEAKSVLDVLPDVPMAIGQLRTVYTLTCYRYGRLGQYGDAIADKPARPAMTAFQKALAAIHTAIEERNKTLPPDAQYPYLDPASIPWWRLLGLIG